MPNDQATLQQSKDFLKILKDGKTIPDSSFNKCLTTLYSLRNVHRDTFDLGVAYGMILCMYYYKTFMKNQE